MNGSTIGNIALSRMAFGTSHLHHVASSLRRERLLRNAVDLGVTHFDTAPLYGFGFAESELGRILARDATITIGTKIGLYGPSGATRNLASVWIRKAGRRFVPGVGQPRFDWSLVRARNSLETSLRLLQRETIDIVLLHEPPNTLANCETLIDWLERERASGRVRAWGVSGEADVAAQWWSLDAKAVLQVRNDLARDPARVLRERDIPVALHYGYLRAARADGSELPITEIVSRAVALHPQSTLLVSTNQPDHLSALVRALR